MSENPTGTNNEIVNNEAPAIAGGDIFSQIKMFMNEEQTAREHIPSPQPARPVERLQSEIVQPRPQIAPTNRNDYQHSNQNLNIEAPRQNIPKPSMPTQTQVSAPSASSAPSTPRPAPIMAQSLDANLPKSEVFNSMARYDRRSQSQEAARNIGNVICCDGSKVIIATEADNRSLLDDEAWSVGQMISISTKHGRIVALVTEMKTNISEWRDNEINSIIVVADILGEVNDGSKGASFKRGVTRYPVVGSLAHKIRYKDLECIYDLGNRKSINVGDLSQNDDIKASVAVDDILRRHMAVVGTTGVGKSCAVSLIVTRAIEADSNLRVVMLDPHNEFAGAFGEKAMQLDQNNLDLPYWLLNFEELEDVIFRSKPVEKESEILRELVVNAKIERQNQLKAVGAKIFDIGSINIDTPVPYKISDILKGIDDYLGHLEPKYTRIDLKNLRVRIELIENNPRYNFMFGRAGREENFAKIISKIFRLPSNGKPMSTINLAGLPSEVINCVASVVARLSFDVARASNGKMRVLLVCEEAHRYVPKERELGFFPTRMAVSRIAKEGRKYGCAIAIVTQRPGELDPTILSQCSTVFAMRLTNELDQEIIRSALSDSSGAIVSFLSSLDNREAIAFGEGVAVPMRLYFDDYDLAKMRAEANIIEYVEVSGNMDDVTPESLVLSMRGIQEQLKVPTSLSENIENKTGQNPENPIRPGLVRPSLLKKDINEILSKHPENLQGIPSLRKKQW